MDATGKSIHVDVYSKFGEFSASVRGYMEGPAAIIF